MTPLPRWVLLATLLGRAIGVPIQDSLDYDACVHFCHTLEGSSSEGCDSRTLVRLQSYERHVGRQGDLTRCLISSCYDETEPNRFQSTNNQHEENCEKIRQDFIQSQQCGCLDLIEGPSGKSSQNKRQQDPSWDPLEEILIRYDQYIRKSGLLGTMDLVEDLMNFQMEKSVEFAKLESNLIAVPDPRVNVNDKKKASRNFDAVPSGSQGRVNGHPDTTTVANSSEEQVDWEMWCMTQCDHGQGGTACNCDIIP